MTTDKKETNAIPISPELLFEWWKTFMRAKCYVGVKERGQGNLYEELSHHEKYLFNLLPEEQRKELMG